MLGPFARLVLRSLALGGVALAGGCGGGQTRGHPLDRSWSDEDGSELREFQQTWSPAAAAAMPELAVGVVDEATLVGRELPDGAAWRFEHALEGRPALGGELVVGIGGGELFALDGRSGELRWVRPAVGSLRGADDDGTTTLVSLGSLSGVRSTVLAIDRDGAVRRELDVVAHVGVPAVRDDIAFLPWDEHFVSAFDLSAGREQARVVSSAAVSRAWFAGDALLLGDHAVLAFDRAIVGARHGGGTRLGLPPREFPGAPRWRRSGANAPPLFADRSDTSELLACPLATGSGQRRRTLGWADNGYALVDRELVLGLDASTGATRWAHVGETPYLGGEAGRTHFCVCDGAGRVRWLAARTGLVARERTLDSPVRACVLRCDRPLAAKAGAGTEQGEPSRARQLLAAASVRDDSLLPLQLELVADLAGQQGDEATGALVTLASSEAAPAELRSEAARRLALRRSGPQALLQALERAAAASAWQPSAAPLAELARAVGALGLEAAAPALGVLLGRPGTTPEQASALAEALETLAGAAQVAPLHAFVARHACGPSDERSRRAVLDAARALLRLGRVDLVQTVAKQPCENEQLRHEIAQLLAGTAAAASARGAPGRAPLEPVF